MSDVYQPEDWSVAEMVIEYARHKGYGTFTDVGDAGRAISKREPKLAQLILKLNRDEDMTWQVYEFLSRPPTLVVDEKTGDIVLTEHGRSMGEAYGEMHE